MSSPTTLPSALPARSAVVDVLRGVAITLVLLLHFSLTYKLPDSPLAALLGRDAVRALVNNGNYGVTMFFVVSGFLITTTSLARYGGLGAIDRDEFIRFRAARIVPCLLLAVAVIVVLGLLGAPSFGNEVDHQPLPAIWFVWGAGSVLTFTHNLLMQSAGYFNYCLNIYWSLSVEEVFYLTFPLASRFLRRNGLIIGLCGLLILGAPVYRAWHRGDELFYECGYLACFDAIAIGCLVALINRRVTLRPGMGRALRIVAALVLVVTYFLGIEGHEVFGFSVIALSTGVLLIRAFDAPSNKSRSAPVRLMCLMGRQSYEVYLFHGIVLAVLRNVVPKGTMPYVYKLPMFALFVIASVLLAGAVARYYAEPANALLRERLMARRTAQA